MEVVDIHCPPLNVPKGFSRLIYEDDNDENDGDDDDNEDDDNDDDDKYDD